MCAKNVRSHVTPDNSIKLVTLTAGGNNVGFAPILQKCIEAGALRGDCWRQSGALSRAIADLEPQLVKLFEDIRVRAPYATIVVGGYPKLFPTGGYNGLCFTLSNTDERWMNSAAASLDFAIQQAVTESGVAQYADAYSIMDGHEACDSQPGWLNALVRNGLSPDSDSFHPNYYGHQAYAQAFARALENPPGTSYTVNPEQQVNVTYDASGDGTAVFATHWPGSTVGVRLTDPHGTVIDATQGPSGGSHTVGPTYEVYRVPHPASGKWTIRLTGTNVAAAGEQVTVNTTQLPAGAAGSFLPAAATAAIAPSSGTAPLTVHVEARSAATGVRYQWLFEDGSTATGAHATHTYTTAGKYSPALVATGANGLDDFVYAGTVAVKSPRASGNSSRVNGTVRSTPGQPASTTNSPSGSSQGLGPTSLAQTGEANGRALLTGGMLALAYGILLCIASRRGTSRTARQR